MNKTEKAHKIDISINKSQYRKHNGFTASKLILEFSGKDINAVILNTIRRVSFDDIPTYAFAYVDIEHNDSVFNNDMMKIRLNQLPIFDVHSNIYYLHPIYWENVDYYDKNREKHDKEIQIEAVVNYYNTKDEIFNVTTDNMSYYINGNQQKYANKNSNEPILLISLRPGETFKCHLKGCLGVGERSNIWAAAGQTYYDVNEDSGKITFTTESNGQMVEHDILIKACKLIKIKLKSIAQEIKNRVDTKEIMHNQVIFFELINEDHTIGNLINNCLQDHKDILFAGLSKPDHLIRAIKFKISSTSENTSPIKPFFESIEYLLNVFDHLEKQFLSLRKKEIGEEFSE